jgi:ABC-type uncharacterized transport system permease subunit
VARAGQTALVRPVRAAYHGRIEVFAGDPAERHAMHSRIVGFAFVVLSLAGGMSACGACHRSSDRGVVYVGSFNLDYRSARLNTEMGVVVDNEALCARLYEDFVRRILDLAYRVEPVGALQLLPIEEQL